MAQDAVVGIIGGQGWMGRSLGLALLEQGILSAEQLVISSRSERNTAFSAWSGVLCTNDNQALAEMSDVIVLSVRPEDLANIEVDSDGKLVVSLLAMTSVEDVAQRLGSRRVVRAMPNAAAEIRCAYFPWYAAPGVTEADKRLVDALLESCGKSRELPAERDLDYLTALSGAGPAYPALLAQSMLEHARHSGIDDDIALEAVMQTLVGGCQLLERKGANPKAMVERLITYDGTTAKGLRAMIDGGFHPIIHAGLTAAHDAAHGSEPEYGH